MQTHPEAEPIITSLETVAEVEINLTSPHLSLHPTWPSGQTATHTLPGQSVSPPSVQHESTTSLHHSSRRGVRLYGSPHTSLTISRLCPLYKLLVYQPTGATINYQNHVRVLFQSLCSRYTATFGDARSDKTEQWNNTAAASYTTIAATRRHPPRLSCCPHASLQDRCSSPAAPPGIAAQLTRSEATRPLMVLTWTLIHWCQT